MLFHKNSKSLFDIVDGLYLSQMTEEEFSEFCDIPTTELGYALGYYMDNLLLPQRNITIMDRTFLSIYKEFQRIIEEIKNDQSSKISYSDIIPKICLADHYRKEIDKEYQKQLLNMKTISSLMDEINDFYYIIQDIHPNIDLNPIEKEIKVESKKRIRLFNHNKNSL